MNAYREGDISNCSLLELALTRETKCCNPAQAYDVLSDPEKKNLGSEVGLDPGACFNKLISEKGVSRLSVESYIPSVHTPWARRRGFLRVALLSAIHCNSMILYGIPSVYTYIIVYTFVPSKRHEM